MLLILIDTLRADKLGCHGSELGLSPHIDDFAASGVRFERAFAHAPWTLPSAASLFTSTPPTVHGAGGRVEQFRKLPDAARTLAECFRDAGYATGAVVNVDFLTAPFGMDQGFEKADFDFVAPKDNSHCRSATATTDAALGWLRTHADRPYFMVVHYFDPHLIYSPPPEFRRKFAAPEDREADGWVFGTREDVVHLRQDGGELDPATVRRAERLYDGEVAYVDSEIGRLLAGVKALQTGAAPILLLTADHGEEFLDHGGFEHGHTLYDELLHVPLVISWPGRLPPGTVSTTVGQMDIAPTLCELAGVPADPAFLGRSLTPSIAGRDTHDRPVLSQGNFWGLPLFGWRQGGYQLIHGPDRVELYQLASDPGQQRNLANAEPQRASQWIADMQLAMKAAANRSGAGRSGGESAAPLTAEESARLRSLGYLSPTPVPP